MRNHQGDDHQGPEAHARHRGSARRGRAGGCGRHRLSTRDLFDRAAATYDAAAFPFFTPFGGALVEFARIGADEDVLDVGCGTGAALAPASRVARSAVGVELSPAMAERARVAAPDAEVIVGDASTLEFADGSFDVVLSAFVVFFMPDPTAALREWARVLKPSGRFVISTWADGDPRWAWERDVRRPYAQEIDSERLREMMQGLQVLDRFNEPNKVESELTAAGLRDVRVVSHEIEFVFRSEDDWWDQLWSHGGRMFLEELSETSLAGFKRDAYAAMQANRDGAGFPRRYTALFASARP